MKAFKCSKCNGISFSAADLEHQINPRCPYCKAGKEHLTEDAEEMEKAIKGS